MSEEIFTDIEKIKQAIIDEGLYEAGMSANDMKELYKTLNRSKQTAKDENDYHQLMSQTERNCTNLKELETNSAHHQIENDNIMEETTLDSEEIFPNENNNDKTSIHNKPDINFIIGSNYKPPVMPTKRNKNLFPILYHNPEVLKLPAKQKSKIINLYLQYEQKKIRCSETKFTDQWGQVINYVPKTVLENNDDKNVDIGSETQISKDCDTEKVEKDFITLKSLRVVKRKNYEESHNSDDDFQLASNKKIKSGKIDLEKLSKDLEINNLPSMSNKGQKRESDEEILSPILHKKSKLNDTFNNVTVNSSTPLPKTSEIQSASNRWCSKISKDKCEKYLPPEVSDRTNKLFDKLKEEENKKKPTEYKFKLNDTGELSDSSDDIFPSPKTTDVHNETTPKVKKGKSTTRKKFQTKTRKKLNLKSNEEESENVSEISATNFYGKNKENEICASNNNENSTMTQCPICSKSFPNSEIEVHASRCEQYDETEEDSLCVICSQYVPNSELYEHKKECIKKITQASTKKMKHKSKQEFLCEVCDKFILDSDPLEHAENCIAILKK